MSKQKPTVREGLLTQSLQRQEKRVELARSIASRLRQFVGDRRHTKRVKVRLAFSLSLVGSAVSRNGSKRISSIRGHTLDLSSTGIALVVPTILVGEQHLVGANLNLNLKLEIPDGLINMQVAPIRYESLDEHTTETGYLIGAKLVAVAERDRIRFNDYVSQLFKS